MQLDNVKTLRDAVNYGKQFLEDFGIENAQYDATELLLLVMVISRTQYLINSMDKIDSGKLAEYAELINKRAEHIPLQHINSDILKAMKRGTSYEKTNALLDKFRTQVPDMAIRTTLICGFPGETEERFQEMKEWVREQRFDRLGCFTYSHEENTTAFELEDNVPQEVKERRVEEIMELQSQISWEKNQEKIGKVFRCIFDRKEGNYSFIKRTEDIHFI